MSWGAIIVGTAGAVVSGINAKRNSDKADDQYKESLKLQKAQQDKLDEQKKEYEEQEFVNPYSDLKNQFANMENVYEDLTVNQQEAQFQAQQGSQQRANIMQNLKGAAGSSGIAGLAQSLANQGALQTKQISASIGRQETSNQALAAKGAMGLQTLERQGQASIDATKAQGDQWVQQAEMDRQATLLGMQAGETAGANSALQQSQANQMNADIAKQQITADLFSTIGSAAGSAGGETDNIFTKK